MRQRSYSECFIHNVMQCNEKEYNAMQKKAIYYKVMEYAMKRKAICYKVMECCAASIFWIHLKQRVTLHHPQAERDVTWNGDG